MKCLDIGKRIRERRDMEARHGEKSSRSSGRWVEAEQSNGKVSLHGENGASF